MTNADIVVHAAALKQVPACEYNPIEAVRTNIDGAANIIDAAINNNVKKVMTISTDKAVHPVNLYGATKMTAEKLFIQANSYTGKGNTVFSCTRYGNVIGSRGSVIPLFLKQKESNVLTITDEKMTRFWLRLEDGVDFVIKCIDKMKGGEIFIPKIPSMKIMDLADVIAPNAEKKIIGIRPGEKIHETLLTEDESRHSKEFNDLFLIEPEHPFWKKDYHNDGKKVSDGFTYTSDNNDDWISKEKIMKIIEEL
jgi:FlaA1/EpsC-like NDP-sugar epimerase